MGLIVGASLAFVLSWLGLQQIFVYKLGFLPSFAIQQPWTFISYPFSSLGDGNALIGVIFLVWWLYGIGGTVERDMGSTRYGIFVAIVTVLCSLAFFIGFKIVPSGSGRDVPYIIGAWIPTVAITVAWGTRYPNTIVNLFMIIPVPAKVVAWVSVAIVFFGTNNPLLAPFSLLPMVLVYFFAANKLPISYGRTYSYAQKPSKQERKREKEYFDDVKRREKQREEKERLRQLFERSLIEDPDDNKEDKA